MSVADARAIVNDLTLAWACTIIMLINSTGEAGCVQDSYGYWSTDAILPLDFYWNYGMHVIATSAKMRVADQAIISLYYQLAGHGSIERFLKSIKSILE